MNLPEYIRRMLEYKESLGYSRKTYESYLKDFQRYFLEAGHGAFTEGTVLPWCEKRDTETPEGFRRRITPLRELAKYLYARELKRSDFCYEDRTLFIRKKQIPPGAFDPGCG